jgi:hypothetical protein
MCLRQSRRRGASRDLSSASKPADLHVPLQFDDIISHGLTMQSIGHGNKSHGLHSIVAGQARPPFLGFD